MYDIIMLIIYVITCIIIIYDLGKSFRKSNNENKELRYKNRYHFLLLLLFVYLIGDRLMLIL